ncbi:protein Spindly-B-like [Saccostrea cucullata]|uniref:protein Spindly-B-like n=1 Tax=Saccostrea cuccullata TaxID=36930 RepID=UPI002ED22AF7
MAGLHGIEALFREHKRLASKLTKEEMRALRSYLDNRLVAEHSDLLFNIKTLKTNFDMKTLQMEETIAKLQKEVELKNELMQQYKSTDTNLATVHKRREERLEREQTILHTDMERLKTEILSLTHEIEVITRERNLLDKELQDARINISDLERIAAKVEAAEKLIIDNEKLKQDVIRCKMNVDNRDREIQRLHMVNENLSKEFSEKSKLLAKLKEDFESCRTEITRQAKELAVKCDSLAIARHNLNIEKQKVRDLENELKMLQEEKEHKPENGRTDSLALRVELLNIHQKHLEGRVRLLEEKVQMYRNQARVLGHDLAKIAQDISNLSQLKDKVVLHGTTIVEKLLIEIDESLQNRRANMETVVNDLSAQVPAIISKDVLAIKQDVMAVKKQAEAFKATEIANKCFRLVQRIEACEKTQMFFTPPKGSLNPSSTNGLKDNNDNIVLTSPRAEMDKTRRRSDSMVNEVSKSQPCFVKKKPPTPVHLLRSRMTQPPTPFSAWRRRSSVSFDTPHSVTPTLIDLNLTSPRAQSPREKSKTFFP